MEILSLCQMRACFLVAWAYLCVCVPAYHTGWMMSLMSHTVAGIPVQLEQQAVPTANPDPLCYPSKYTQTHPPVYSTLLVVQTAPQPHFRPLFFQSSRLTAPPRQVKEPNYTLSNNKSLLWPHNGSQGVVQAREETPSLIKAGHKQPDTGVRFLQTLSEKYTQT